MDEHIEPKRRRGNVLLLSTIIIIASIVGLYAAPPTFSEPDLTVRVAIIDSGITITQELETRVVAAKSFVNISYGYPDTDNSTDDSIPGGVVHGSYIATIIASEAPDAALVNAKVVSEHDIATPTAIIAAIRWAVLEENCSVINLSLGISPIHNDSIGAAVQWAFRQGVSIVAAAGNNGQGGISGSSVESPAMYPEVIAVAAVDEDSVPYSFSAIGPLRDRTMKPDISAIGYYQVNGKKVLGTSFAAPIVAAGAAKIISHCINNGWTWTPGMIKAAIMLGAFHLPFEEWVVGAGLLDIVTSLQYIDISQKQNGLPLLAIVTPATSPFSFERYFVNHTSRIQVSIFSSTNDSFSLAYTGLGAKWLTGPSSVFVNQTASFFLELRVESSQAEEDQEASISVASPGYFHLNLEFSFDAIVALYEVAFDISHTPWAIDSIYGQFRRLYRTLTKAGIAIDELRFPENLTLDTLSNFDLVFVLDPCAWAYSVDGFVYEKVDLFSYTPQQLAAYAAYFQNGGNLFLVGLTNSSINQECANALFSKFNITLNDDHIPGITIIVNGVSSTELINGMIEHQITDRVDAFDYNGCSLNFTGDPFEIAWKDVIWQDENGTYHSERRSVLVGLEYGNSSRLIATGSNFFLDNWALSNSYRSDQDLRFVLQTVYWLLHALEH
ncbi:MAG: S8 family serine peptidase [Candidatus Thorarchaeota archaeon]